MSNNVLPEVIGSRMEHYLNYLARGGKIEDLPNPVSRSDYYLYYLCTRGISSEGDINNDIYEELNTENKTIIGAINENRDDIDNINNAGFVNRSRITNKAEVMNGWELSNNSINRLTKLDIGFTVFEFEVVLKGWRQEGAVDLKIPVEFAPQASTRPITFSVYGNNVKTGSGFVYSNGDVRFSRSYTTGSIITCSCIILND